jgi:hypothetical protein
MVKSPGKDFIVAGMRVKVFSSGHSIIDIRGRRGEALFFMATITPDKTLSQLKACVTAVEQAISRQDQGAQHGR